MGQHANLISMKTAPVLYSIIQPNFIGQVLKSTYNLSSNCTCRIFRTGINHTYFVEDNTEKFVFRVYSHNWRTFEEIQAEINLLLELKKNNISTTHPIPNPSGQYIQKIQAPEGERFAVLFSFAEGKKVKSLSNKHCIEIGKLMAQIHQVTVNQKTPRIEYTFKTLVEEPYQYALQFFDENLEEMKLVKLAGELVQELFTTTKLTNIRQGIVHIDIWYDNMNITDDGDITLFDFDFCGNGWLVLDLAYTSVQLFHTEPDKEKFKEKLNMFFKGYESVEEIADDEKRLIPKAAMAIWLFYLGVQAQRFNDWSNIFYTENYLKHYIGMLKNWMEFHNIPSKIA